MVEDLRDGKATRPADATLDERRLIRSAQGGDAAAFVTLLRRHEPRLRSLAYRILRNRDLVPDAMQETALRAFRSLHTYRGGAAFGTWLYRITYTSCLDLLASGDRQLELAERSLTALSTHTPDPAEQIGRRDVLSRALDRLSPEQRAATWLCIQQGYDLGTAAEIMGVPYGTAGSRLSIARGVLRKALAGDRGDG